MPSEASAKEGDPPGRSARLERPDVHSLAHGRITGVIGVQVVPGQLGERAVGHVLRFHVAGGRRECRRNEIHAAVVWPAPRSLMPSSQITWVRPDKPSTSRSRRSTAAGPAVAFATTGLTTR